MRRKLLLPFVLGGALSVAAIAPAAAASPQTNVAAASGLLGVTVQAVLNNVDILNNSANDFIDVNVNDSFNNLLQNALQNAEILNDLEVRIQNVLNDLDINVSDIEIEVLENGDIQVVVLGAGGIADTITIG